MGYLKEMHGMSLLGNTPKGTCPICAAKHKPEQPHNQQSLVYQYKFYDEHGQWPTWADAMKHCSDDIKRFWINKLKEYGIEVKTDEENTTQ